ncbi:MAG: penicillin-binding protein 1C [Rhodobacteraceae bacterium]|nr:penicillin-binding protein 1C [Paracoccaceae bacterium]
MRRGGIIGGTLCLLATLALSATLDQWVRRTDLPSLNLAVSTTVEDRNGELLRAFTIADGRWRLPVSSDAVDPDYLQQLIAFEDKRFYRHGGVDLRAMVRAVGQAIWNGEIVSGGSTLTMQVARLLEQGRTGSWQAKLRQVRVALALERKLEKDEILNLYLHLAPFGGNIEGARAASLTYFRKEPGRLTDAEAALLVALPQSPERRRPDRRTKAAGAARERVLQRLVRAKVLSQDAADSAMREKIPSRRHVFPNLAPHLSEQVVAAHPDRSTHRLSIDKTVQAAVEGLARSYVNIRHPSLSAAVVIVDHQTGEIVTSVGGPDYLDEARSGFLDMTLAVRSPGSALKPLIYGLAFEMGRAHPETFIDDRPTQFGSYAPQNFDNQFRGAVRVRQALQMSLNIPAVTLLQEVGPTQLIARMQRAGAVPKLPTSGAPGLAIALGGLGVTLKEMVMVYAAIARGGVPVDLTHDIATDAVLAARQPVLDGRAAWYVMDILSGMPPPDNAPRNTLAYKTGTSYGHRDAWALGFDGQHTIGVWLGRPDGAAMPGKLGRDLAAPLLFESFALLKPRLEPLPQPPDTALVVSNAELPVPLRYFRTGGVLASRLNNPKIAFPPDGARIDLGALAGEEAFLALKVRDGAPPFTWLANGRPVEVASFERQAIFAPDGPGHLSISVIDSRGQSQQVDVVLE